VKNNVVPAIPGKQVVTRHDQVVRGTLERIEPDGSMVLKCGDMRLTVAGKEILMVQDVNLAVAFRYVNPGFSELKDYVTDVNRPDGLKSDMVARISQKLKQPEAAVREIFDQRLATDATINDQGQFTKTPTYVTVHNASYGRGSWLREGVRPAPLAPNGVAPPRRNPRQANQAKQPDPDENPDLTDDPEVWWRFQTAETQAAVLRAMAAEKVFSATVLSEMCPNCRGAGYISVMAGGDFESQRCPYCRGIGKLFTVAYK